MKVILWNLRKSLIELFPTNKFRLILISLSLLAASISVSELLVAKFFTQIILHEGELTKRELIIFVIAFFLFKEFKLVTSYKKPPTPATPYIKYH